MQILSYLLQNGSFQAKKKNLDRKSNIPQFGWATQRQLTSVGYRIIPSRGESEHYRFMKVHFRCRYAEFFLLSHMPVIRQRFSEARAADFTIVAAHLLCLPEYFSIRPNAYLNTPHMCWQHNHFWMGGGTAVVLVAVCRSTAARVSKDDFISTCIYKKWYWYMVSLRTKRVNHPFAFLLRIHPRTKHTYRLDSSMALSRCWPRRGCLIVYEMTGRRTKCDRPLIFVIPTRANGKKIW